MNLIPLRLCLIVGLTLLALSSAVPSSTTLIVKFDDYHPHSTHTDLVQRATGTDTPSAFVLPSTGDTVHWSVLPRHNPASKFPSDFAVIKLGPPSLSALAPLVAAHLSSRPGIKYAVPDSAVRMPLSSRRSSSPPARARGGPRAAMSVEPDGDTHHPTTGGGVAAAAAASWDHTRVFALRRASIGNRQLLTTTNTLNDDINQTSPDDWLDAQERELLSVTDDTATGDQPPPTSDEAFTTASARRRHLNVVTEDFGAAAIWGMGYTGKGIKVAVFDTGLRKGHPHFKTVVERTNWTGERTLDDGLGHGTFVAGIIASQGPAGGAAECPGFAPDADLYVFRVFTNKQVSYTSWFLDAFNYALHVGVHVLNLSIGGPDFNDRPFVDKVWELSANGVIVVSAIGNDGPLYGTLNNPADMADVIAVGGINRDNRMSPFSSRGMTTWELPRGYGRVKPDIVAYAQHLHGSRIDGGCRTLSGTSVASPVVAGAVALLASVVPSQVRWSIINPASMKQALVSTATRLPYLNLFEQGAGRMNLAGAFDYLRSYSPRVTLFPPELDLTDCPYMWPYCEQPLYAGSLPAIANVTVLNGVGMSGRFLSQEWTPGVEGHRLRIRSSVPSVIWPWSSWIAITIEVVEEPGPRPADAGWSGKAGGELTVEIETYPEGVLSVVALPITVQIVPTPPRRERVLFDVFHSIRYPSAYVPRDDLDVKDDVLDWNADHPHTNYRSLFTQLRQLGYYVEILGSDWTCFDASQYGVLMIVDPEDEFSPAEVSKLRTDVKQKGLSVVVFADWYDSRVMERARFYDENTQSWWTPITGGANIPALNDLLEGFGIRFGSRVYTGDIDMSSTLTMEAEVTKFASGNAITEFPTGGYLLFRRLQDQSNSVLDVSHPRSRGGHKQLFNVPIAGIVQSRSSRGRLAVYGDSNCVDDSHLHGSCWWLLSRLMAYASNGVIPDDVFPPDSRLHDTYFNDDDPRPERRPDAVTGFSKYSNVLRLSVLGGSNCDPHG